MALATAEYIAPIRHASRKLVRELGFMRRTLAGTHLSPSACHCLIEIGDFGINTIKGLSAVLAVDENEVRASLQELFTAGDADSKPEPTNPNPATDNVVLQLTPKGMDTLSYVNHFAREQIQRALDTADPESGKAIANALLQYAVALERCRTVQPPLASGHSPNPPKLKPRSFHVVTGYRPGILARIIQMHMDYYWPTFRFGRAFETEIGKGFSDVLGRLESPLNELWAAVEALPDGTEKILGSVIIDGESLGDPGQRAHLRAYIVDADARGLGVGRTLLSEAVKFVDKMGFDETRLWTLDALDVAKRLYEAQGFIVVYDQVEPKWGQMMRVLQYSRRKTASSSNDNGQPR
jgi:GNAT superfamily N-acetyltransferase